MESIAATIRNCVCSLGGREIFERRTSGDPRQQTAQSMADGPGFQSAEPFDPAQAFKIRPRVSPRRIQKLAAPGGHVEGFAQQVRERETNVKGRVAEVRHFVIQQHQAVFVAPGYF